VVRALENPGAEPTYLEFFGFTRAPFAQLSGPAQIFHSEQYSLLMAHLANATERSDRLVVICGADGSGKTTILTRHIANLSDDICFAVIDESCNGEKQFYCALLRQLGFSAITGTPRELRHIAKEFIVQRGMAGDTVLMMIDNAHLIHPSVLEQLRWISAIKVNDRRVLSVVLAGNSDLKRIMDSPAMIQVKFRSHVHFNIRVYTEEETANYVWHHLKMAGGIDGVQFSSDAHPLIYRYTGGIPNLINTLCNAVLAEAYDLESRVITEDLVRTVADKRRLVPHVVPLQGMGRRRTDPDYEAVQPKRQVDECTTSQDSTNEEADENPEARQEVPDLDGKKLLERISQLSEQVGELKADGVRALRDVAARDKDISELHSKLDAQITETDRLSRAFEDNAGEISRLNNALLESAKSLQEQEEASKKLVADLEKERNAAKAAQAEIASANEQKQDNSGEIGRLNKALSESAQSLQEQEETSRKLVADLEIERSAAKTAQAEIVAAREEKEELTDLISILRAEVNDLTADLKVADERFVEMDVLENDSKAAKAEIELLVRELDAGNEVRYGLEKLLQQSQKECDSLRPLAAALEEMKTSVSEKDARIESLEAELAEQRREINEIEAKYEELESRNLELVATEMRASRADSADEKSDSTITAFEIAKDGEIEQLVEFAGGPSRIMIGRSENSELYLNSKYVSRHHALIYCTEQGLYIEDLNSCNGTIVNSKQITRCELHAGDFVMIGDFQIRPK
jgi:type II secretory pathway predicted ATPase ExeA/predicted  nucleic acid-binding Zn-ribbon protein